MKMTVTINIGNYENVKLETDDFESEIDCYLQMKSFLLGWKDMGGTRILENIERRIKEWGGIKIE